MNKKISCISPNVLNIFCRKFRFISPHPIHKFVICVQCKHIPETLSCQYKRTYVQMYVSIAQCFTKLLHIFYNSIYDTTYIKVDNSMK